MPPILILKSVSPGFGDFAIVEKKVKSSKLHNIRRGSQISLEFLVSLISPSGLSLFSSVSSWSPSRASSDEINHVEDNHALRSLLSRPLVPLPCFSVLPAATSLPLSPPPPCSVQRVCYVNAALGDVTVRVCDGNFTQSARDVILRHTW